MKKLLLSFTAIAALVASASAQAPRLPLYEEFTGENCGPCAQTNPGLWTLISTPGNDGVKVQMIKYMEPIPSSGFFYLQDKAVSDARLTYYGVNSTPNGRFDGTVPDPGTNSPGHPGYFTQSDINTEAALTSPFTISVNSTWNATHTQVTSVIKVKAVGVYAGTGSNVKLRVALVQTVHFTTIPCLTGESNEQEFEYVTRAMFPDATGTVMASTWAVGDSMTYTIVGNVPNYVDINKNPFVVAWIQNDADKSISQSARSAALPTQGLTVDAGIDSTTTLTFACGAAGSTSTATAILHNYGSTPITAATIYSKVNSGAWTSQAWTGNLAPNATAQVSISVAIPAPGSSDTRVYDSVAVAGDYNFGNNNNYGNAYLQVTPATFAQVGTGFENQGLMPAGYLDLNGLFNIYWSGSTSQPLGHNGSEFALAFANFQYAAGTTDYLIIPTPAKAPTGKSTLEFFYAYAQQLSTDNDALDVVMSADCGTTWTSLWNRSGANLATGAISPINPSTGAGEYVPSSNADYNVCGLDISSYPAGTMYALKTTAGGGNFLWIDDIGIRDYALNVANTTPATSNISLYPNPAKDNATLSITLAAATNVRVDVIDAIGRTVATVANENMTAGTQKVNISTNGLASGIYNVKIVTDAGTTTQRLSVVK